MDFADHLELLRSASLIETDGPFVFVHAGIDPAKPGDAQDRKDYLTIRKGFLDCPGPLSHVVHGHTITESRLPEIVGSRVAIDTGAYGTGRLTALILDPAADGLEFAWTLETGSRIAVEAVSPRVIGLVALEAPLLRLSPTGEPPVWAGSADSAQLDPRRRNEP
jgi:serine/threonine protein phosphatase 1